MYRFYVEIYGLTVDKAKEIVFNNDLNYPNGAMLSKVDNLWYSIKFDHRLAPVEVKQLLRALDPEDFVEITIK